MKITPKRRKREGKTNYCKRKKLLESRRPRIIIRKTNRYITIQYAESKAALDFIKATANSKELLKYGWPEKVAGSLKSLPAAYLTGFLFGNKAKALGKNVKEEKGAAVDTGLIRSTKGSRLYAAQKGIVDSGFDIKHNSEVFPADERIKNEKVSDFFDKVKGNIAEKIKGAEKRKK